MMDRSNVKPVDMAKAAAPGFARMVYHATKGHKIVRSEGDLKAHLADGWEDKPIVADPEPAPASVEERFAALEARVDALENKKKK